MRNLESTQFGQNIRRFFKYLMLDGIIVQWKKKFRGNKFALSQWEKVLH